MGVKTTSIYYFYSYLISQSSISWSHLNAGESKKCSLAVFSEEKGNEFGQ